MDNQVSIIENKQPEAAPALVNEVQRPAPSNNDRKLDISKSILGAVVPPLEHTAAAVSARTAYLGLTDQLHVDQYTMRNALARLESPVAKQLVATMDDLKANGWEFVRTSKNFNGSYVPFTQRIHYSPTRFSMLAYMAGSYVSPIKRTAAGVLAHELAHHKAPLTYFVSPTQTAASETMAKRHLVAEAKAMLAEVHIADELRVTQGITADRKAALKSGRLGSQILLDHPEATMGMQGKDVAANKLVHGYLDETFGKDVIDRTTGKVRPYNPALGLNQPLFAALPDDPMFLEEQRPGRYLELRKDPVFEQRTRLGVMLSASESRFGSVAIRTAKAAGAVGAFVAVNDVYGAFHEGPGSGFGRLAKVGTDWAGFELATLAGRNATAKLFTRHPKTAIVTTFGIGIVGALTAGEYVGKPLENAVKSGIDNPSRRFSLSDYH